MIIDEHTFFDNEDKRLKALNSYNILDTIPEKEYDAITRLASYICQAPIALVSLIDNERQWFKSKVGLDVDETPRADAFCHYTIMGDDLLEINDTLESDLFRDNTLVQNSPNIRFYAGAPLIDAQGFHLGSLCVIDSVPRKLSFEQRDALKTLANEVISHLTLRKQNMALEDNLEKHQEFSNLFNSSREIHCITDRDFNIELINRSVFNILGYVPEELAGKPIWNFFIEESKTESLSILRKGLQSQKRTFEIETLIIAKSGDIKCVSWSLDFNNHKMYASGRDITRQKEIAAEMEQLSLVASKVDNGVVISDSSDKVLWVNEGFEKITGFGLKDLQSRLICDVISTKAGEGYSAEQLAGVTTSHQPYELDFFIERKGGGQACISVIKSVLRDQEGQVTRQIRVIIDITEKKKAELELIAAKEEAVQLSRAKDMFISVMSHEIRTPLNAVIGMSHLLQESNPLESQKENLGILKFSAENLMHLINDVLDFTKIETGNIELEATPMSVRELIQGVASSMQYKLGDKNVYLKSKVDDNIPEIIIGDRTRVCQILLNLVSNSVKFTEQGGITIDVSIAEQTDADISIRFAVTDTGIGIAANKIDTIFESFKQAEADTTRKYGGTGLGLAITKRLIELHRSKIHVESVLGQGSTFWFIIKFTKTHLNVNAININNTVETELQLNILVVDDNQINRLLINKVLRKWGVEADFAENGLEAVSKIENNHEYDVVLMDIHMPEMGGLEATQIVRAKTGTYYRQLPIVALTASLLSNEIDAINSSGMNDYILKPFEPKGLYDKLSRYQRGIGVS